MNTIHNVSQLSAASLSWLTILVDLSGKSLAMLGFALLTSLCLRRASAAHRHLMWGTTLSSLLVLPVLVLVLPAWRMEILPKQHPTTLSASAAKQDPLPAAVTRVDPSFTSTTASPRDTEIDTPVLAEVVAPERQTQVVVTAPSSSASFDWRRGVLILWLFGALVAIGPLLIGMFAVRRLISSARAPSDASWTLLADAVRQQIGLRRTVRLLESHRVCMPMSCSLFIPTVLLPVAADEWSPERRRLVLLHELAHVKRWDCHTQLMACLACALYWYNPLVWFAARQLRQERERACDDCVLNAGSKASAYAWHLLEIARAFHGLQLASWATVAMAQQKSQLEGRLLAILDAARNRNRLSGGVGILSVLLACMLILPLAALHVCAATVHTPDENSDVVLQSSPAEEKSGEVMLLSGRVLDPDGSPVQGAELTVWLHFGYWGYYQYCHEREIKQLKPRFGATSGADGRFEFALPLAEIDENPMNIWDQQYIQIVAAAKGYGPAWTGIDKGNHSDLTLQLEKDNIPVEGRVLDLQGQPVAGAKISVERVTIGDDEFHSLWQPSWASLPADLRTDDKGRFVLTGIGRDRNTLLHIDGPTMEHKIVSVSTYASADATVENMRVEFIIGPSKPIIGTIRARDTGEPLAGVVVYGNENTNHRQVRAVTDERGRYRLTGLPKTSEYELTVYPSVSQSYLGTLERASDSEGLKPLTVDFELRKGVEVRCRFIDKETGRSVRGALQYSPLATNPYYREAEVAPGYIPTREFSRIHVPDQDGVFRLVAYPGPGVVLFNGQANHNKYVHLPVDAADKEKAKGDMHLEFADILLGYRMLDPVEGDDPVVVEIELTPIHADKDGDS